jgi:hypothetical protein
MQQVPYPRHNQFSTGPRETTVADEFAGYTIAVVGLAALVFAPGVFLGAVLGASAVTLSHRLRDSGVTLASLRGKPNRTAACARTEACP